MKSMMLCRTQRQKVSFPPRSRRVLEVLENNHKNMINKIQESPSSIIVTRKPNGLRDFG
jgi:hypothetical protein